MNVWDYTDADVRKRALEHECPECGAKADIRCRILTPNTMSGRTKVDVRRKPCPERATQAWRKMLAEV